MKNFANKKVIIKIMILDFMFDDRLHQSLLQKHLSIRIPSWYSVLQMNPRVMIFPGAQFLLHC